MDIGIVSTRYAKALLGYAQGAGKEDIVYEELKNLTHNLESHPELSAGTVRLTLPSRRISPSAFRRA